MTSKRQHDWDKLYSEFITTNLSPGAFAKQKGIPSSCAYTQFQKRAKMQANSDESTVEIIPVNIISKENNNELNKKLLPSTEQTAIELKINNFSILIRAGFDKTVLTDTIEVLRALC